MLKPTVIVHGGAGVYSAINYGGMVKDDQRTGVVQAAKDAYNILTTGGSALDAVEAAVVYMEKDPRYNAGVGSYFTVDRTIEMDASIMDGKTLGSGAVGSITNVAYPVKVARKVMEQSHHVLLTGEGANRFSKEVGAEQVTTEYLTTEKAIRRLQNCTHFKSSSVTKAEYHPFGPERPQHGKRVEADEHDTVGAVALDKDGNVAYATSTGGISNKVVGRVGDCPLFGCGGYADNNIGAITTTGDGEAFVKTCLSHRIIMKMEQGQDIQVACEDALKYMYDRVGGLGGVVGISKKGDVGMCFSTEGMTWASIQDDVIHSGLDSGDDIVENFVA